MNNIDSINAVKIYFKIKNIKQTLNFIRSNINKKDIVNYKMENICSNKIESTFLFDKRDYTSLDIEYWNNYGIYTKDLQKERVFSISKLILKKDNNITREWNINKHTLCFVFSGFDYNRLKVYFPNQKKYKFLGTCNKNDIGDLNYIDNKKKHIIITKSYKDSKVLRNLGYNSIWFQSENSIPDKEVISKIISNFKRIYIIFDNDIAGIKGSKKLHIFLYNLFKKKKIKEIFLDKYKDVSEYYKNNRKKLIKILNTKIKL